ncbi:MAG: bifunctional alpha,alpha-trehalose-phosphate synthase (UDP-forming)/trehalose-phosphatase [Candidatus Methylarchaceae archaeon HK01B]|nr:bifunctional alpha,alpha-trehalose-phosphate synthase (UDP-forming)/trehalose-phosphatase [Candidatus Methylarchaceae archaeon HK02M1]MCP8318822.1 bifunctional alpha,alpha-trehalose-phosphate synthase (UDP-forming)/trehalose-phosphatase [Candidatus Methylarchaceae archaeon HK01B]
MVRLLIVSNRLPVTIVKRKGKLHFQPSTGGLATGLSSFYKSYQSLWIGWPGTALNEIKGKEKDVKERLLSESCYPVFLSRHDIENYYHSFCNKTIWPLFHYFPQFTMYNESWWDSYKKVNKAFYNAIVKVAEPDDIIWINDYHLMLLPKLIREKLPEATIGFFLHIPFPSFEIFRLLPWRKEIIEGLLGSDLIGFHTYDYVWNFLDSVRRLLGYEHTLSQITAGNRIVKADAFPMGIDYKRFVNVVHEPEVQREINRVRKEIGERKIILSIDRLDYTKGILLRLEAFDAFLEKNPKYKEKVTLILVASPSRIKVEQYKQLKKQLDELVGRVNGKYGTIGWTPIWYLYRFLPFHALIALYNIADVALLTPLRDGMNLIAKEFIATKTDGKSVLILSEMTGAAHELGEAIVVNPNNKEEVAEALKEALSMPDEEQIERNRIMQMRLQRYNAMRWASDFMDRLFHTKELQKKFHAKRLTYEIRRELISEYSKSNNRLILLDYDGTLVTFGVKPEKIKPDDELLRLLEEFAREPENDVVIISGRDKDTLEKWFGELSVGLIAEHGVWIKEKEKTWEMVEPLENDWKDEIRPILEIYVDRTPGSFIEEKDFSLVWHYRKSNVALGVVRARELTDDLLHLTENLDLGVLEGSKVIEIKNIGINKGRAALRLISKRKWDFILAIGDDWTDEDVFEVLPESAYSIKVGFGPSKARFNLDSVTEVRSLLKELVQNKREKVLKV